MPCRHGGYVCGLLQRGRDLCSTLKATPNPDRVKEGAKEILFLLSPLQTHPIRVFSNSPLHNEERNCHCQKALNDIGSNRARVSAI